MEAENDYTSVEVFYFKLKETKIFSNGNNILSGELLIKSEAKDGNQSLYNTVEATSQVKWFWAKDDEVIFQKSNIEQWSKEDLEARDKMINNSWV